MGDEIKMRVEILRYDSLQRYFSFLIYIFAFFYSCRLIFDFVVFVIVIDMRRCKRSLQSFIMSLYSVGDSKLVSLRRSSQYSVSVHSFK